ncbi:hypothetical protein GDO81_028238 [Engystomops pustulosus]|uniref:Uncharacterized protein n=1 Tax=Engystomops pustulosus TaxID=76066 RepID=A0AAV6ZDA6_ENGPU|nr:hypothetical protein GDO81_028238 [Engystomops pustulosus]
MPDGGRGILDRPLIVDGGSLGDHNKGIRLTLEIIMGAITIHRDPFLNTQNLTKNTANQL